jgi:hypothetical protein
MDFALKKPETFRPSKSYIRNIITAQTDPDKSPVFWRRAKQQAKTHKFYL